MKFHFPWNWSMTKMKKQSSLRTCMYVRVHLSAIFRVLKIVHFFIISFYFFISLMKSWLYGIMELLVWFALTLYCILSVFLQLILVLLSFILLLVLFLSISHIHQLTHICINIHTLPQVIEGGAPLLGRNGMTVVTIRIKEMSMSLENKSFVAVFSPVHTHNVREK